MSRSRNGQPPSPPPQNLPKTHSSKKKKLQVAEAKIEALEAQAEPYSAEELALIRASAAEPAKPNPATETKQPKREFPASAGQIALEAQRAYNSRRYEEAESKFLDILDLEKDNVFTLANLAAAQMELNKLTEAEANLNKALGQQPNDAYSLSLKGLVKFRQNDYDSALDLLSQAAVLEPDNAQTQNYLGLALSQKGLRIAAEAAFRKAVKIAPAYSVAHYNLAVFYATADAPSPELARWHYQKALSSGHPKSPDLEKMLN
jgi:tetratricopeptide (TPR) repeat protein